MPVGRATNALIAVNVFRGDAKTLLAFDPITVGARTGLAGFTIEVRPPDAVPYYIDNDLRLAPSPVHTQVPEQSPFSSVNAPIQKFRWVHVPPVVCGESAVRGSAAHTYVVTPRYFDDAGMLRPLDTAVGVTVTVEVAPFRKGTLAVGFTGGCVQSQAYVRHFGDGLRLRPPGTDPIYDTAAPAGRDGSGRAFSYDEVYEWLGFTAHQQIRSLLAQVRGDTGLTVDVFAYDLDEPGVCTALLELATAGRARIVLDNAALHHDPARPTAEDVFAGRVRARASDAVKRGRFDRYAHDKILIVSDRDGPRTVLTGSADFSVTGLYADANHVLVFEDRQVATAYAEVFEQVWRDDAQAAAFAESPWARQRFTFGGHASATPATSVTFSPHPEPVAVQVLGDLVHRIDAEATVAAPQRGSVFFTVTDGTAGGANPVFDILNGGHADAKVFSLGIADGPNGTSLYGPGQWIGAAPGGRSGRTVQPPSLDRMSWRYGRRTHHKFVVCGFRGEDPVVYCGSSTLALAGEQDNGDNLLAIRDADVATAFVIEALLLVEHYQLLNRLREKTGRSPEPAGDIRTAVTAAGWVLEPTDAWTDKYFDPADPHCIDRELFGGSGEPRFGRVPWPADGIGDVGNLERQHRDSVPNTVAADRAAAP